MFVEMFSEHLDIVKKKKIESNFKPSTKTLVRIMKTLAEEGAEAKTALSVDANVNYSRLAKHIVWMEAKGLVESKIYKSKIKVELTKKGKDFTSILTGK